MAFQTHIMAGASYETVWCSPTTEADRRALLNIQLNGLSDFPAKRQRPPTGSPVWITHFVTLAPATCEKRIYFTTMRRFRLRSESQWSCVNVYVCLCLFALVKKERLRFYFIFVSYLLLPKSVSMVRRKEKSATSNLCFHTLHHQKLASFTRYLIMSKKTKTDIAIK